MMPPGVHYYLFSRYYSYAYAHKKYRIQITVFLVVSLLLADDALAESRCGHCGRGGITVITAVVVVVEVVVVAVVAVVIVVV